MFSERLLALDIETTGLDPSDSSVVAVGLCSSDGAEVLVGEERSILARLQGRIESSPVSTVLVTWNGEEFDLPFLHVRMQELGFKHGPILVPRGELGKYGKPLYRAQWGEVQHLDIAPFFRDVAADFGIRWSLKPVARAVLGAEPVEVDNRGEAIAAMAINEVQEYVASDARITLALAAHRIAKCHETDELVRGLPL